MALITPSPLSPAEAYAKVNATALAETVKENSDIAASAVRRATEELCAGDTTPEIAVTAMANATAKVSGVHFTVIWMQGRQWLAARQLTRKLAVVLGQAPPFLSVQLC